MIQRQNDIFRLETRKTSYLFRITEHGHLEHIYYGARLPGCDIDPLLKKRVIQLGTSVLYDQADPTYCLDTLPLEWSGIGKGDYRHTPAEMKMPDGTFVADFVYRTASIKDGPVPSETLPLAHSEEGQSQSLILELTDTVHPVRLQLIYTVFWETNVITRRTILTNLGSGTVMIRKLMSLMLDLPNSAFRLITLHGGWIREANRQEQVLAFGVHVHESTTGASSHRHHPAFALAERNATEDSGRVFGFNLIYSGNHYEAIERSETELVRVMTGINPSCFEWTLNEGESFETPEAVMTFSNEGLNGMSSQMHDFINQHIIPPAWQGKERPILINSWETFMFRFHERNLIKLAGLAKKSGIELFVLDDGWFGQRDDDTAGLGDYDVNRKKLPHGLAGLAKKLNRMGLKFGLWFEPEMANPDSNLYRQHPEYTVQVPGRQPSLGRNQLVLDLCNPAVRDYIVESVRSVLDSASIDYVKWDMNRNISDAFSAPLAEQGQFFHRYILGLYDVLGRIFGDKPDILLESCASGGNRFDLGMLCFSPQIWASDNTDPIERLKIQGGLSLFYPPSTLAAHVSAAPHQQTLRQTPLETRFNVACFGCLGYELNLHDLDSLDRKVIADQIEFYKKYRPLFQFGRFYRLSPIKRNQVGWQVVLPDQSQSIAGLFQTLAEAAPPFDRLPLTGLLSESFYEVSTRPQKLRIKSFGALINYLLPVRLRPDGPLLSLANRLISLPDCVERYEGSGRQLQEGIFLHDAFTGTGYNERVRMMGDFGSYLYVIKVLINEKKGKRSNQL